MSMQEIMSYENYFMETYSNSENTILANSPELRFMEYICWGEAEAAASLFEENQMFGGVKSAVDAPQGRFEGIEGIRRFAKSWLESLDASQAWVVPVNQSRSGGRSCTEVMACFQLAGYERPLRFPVCVVGDLRGNGKLDEVRIYFFFKWLPGLSAYRHRIFKPARDEPADLNQMAGVIREYFDALHTLDQENGMERMLATFTDDIVYGGYRPESISGIIRGKEPVRKKYDSFVQMKQFVRVESIVDDGKTAVCEWVGVFRPKYAESEKDSLLQSGVGIYDRDWKTGLIKSVRIIDNFRFQNEIDWDKVTIRY